MHGERPTQPVGRYTFDLIHDRWDWSPEIYTMHGYQPGEVVPSTQLLLEHTHPDDRARVEESFGTCLHAGQAFTCYHRMTDTRQRLRRVLILGEGLRDDDGQTTGYLIDLSGTHAEEVRIDTEQHVRAALDGRLVIEQAKGALMQCYGVDAETAWQLLRKKSQQHNVKVRDLAAWILEDIFAQQQPPRLNQERAERLLHTLIERHTACA